MRKLKSQHEKVMNKLISQFKIVSKKFKPEARKEITNQDIQIALYQYSMCNNPINEYGEKSMEWLHERLTLLSESQMELIRLRFFKAYSLAEIADEMMLDHHEKVSRELIKIYEILRG